LYRYYLQRCQGGRRIVELHHNQPSLALGYVVEHEGEEQQILGTFIAAHTDRRLVGTAGAGFLVGDANSAGAVAFTVSQGPAGYTVWANNTDSTTPYNISFTTTNSAANSQWVPLTILAALDPPNLPSVDVTSQISIFDGGDVVCTPIAPASAALAANKKLALHSQAKINAPTNTLLGNLGISTIIASATWQVYRSAVGNSERKNI